MGPAGAAARDCRTWLQVSINRCCRRGAGAHIHGARTADDRARKHESASPAPRPAPRRPAPAPLRSPARRGCPDRRFTVYVVERAPGAARLADTCEGAGDVFHGQL
ncbi:hypothetical protein JYU34_012414 [Plutella xylostella]|uniref:Uncharacterized protein n=1 Tax=Plutella xylostella TaxID=51655 RepID=A0ABQ7QEY4_PLUXY|nr:hypothetical protein JYU34_012414 [Plutella xylostella]